MKVFRVVKIVAICSFALGVMYPTAAEAKDTRKSISMYVEAETLVAGNWKVHKTGSALGGKFLYGSKNTGPLKTKIKLSHAGKYHVWVRVRSRRTVTHRGRITVNGRVSGVLGGKGRGWKWYNLGVYECSVLKLVLEGLDAAPQDVWYDTFFITETSEPPGPAAIKRPEPVWIWSKKKTSAGLNVFFRRHFSLPDKAEGGRLFIRAGGPYVVYVNGVEAASDDNWREFREFDIKRYLRKGENLLAVRCRQGRGVEGGGLQLEAKIKLSSGGKISLRSGNKFRVQKKEFPGWNRPDFDDSLWWHAREYWANPLRKFTVSEKRLFEELNLNYPGLEKVKAAWEKGDPAAAKEELLKYYKTRRKPKYFFDWRKKNEIVKLIKEKDPNYYRKQIARADSFMTHVFTFEGDKRFVGKDINWFQDSPGGNKSYAILLSSLNWLSPLLSSYWATGDEKYVREYVYMTDDWIKDNL
ncbi:MAG: hypothetical protein K8S55_01225, partial [Phycisphaerae bacterium]|nr:hypothetical protein [Phycisphaerae bacterium]